MNWVDFFFPVTGFMDSPKGSFSFIKQDHGQQTPSPREEIRLPFPQAADPRCLEVAFLELSEGKLIWCGKQRVALNFSEIHHLPLRQPVPGAQGSRPFAEEVGGNSPL